MRMVEKGREEEEELEAGAEAEEVRGEWSEKRKKSFYYFFCFSFNSVNSEQSELIFSLFWIRMLRELNKRRFGSI